MTSADRPIMCNEQRQKLERIISGAVREARNTHPKMPPPELTSSIAKRLIPNLLNSFVVVERDKAGAVDGDPLVLKDELYRVRRNYEQTARDMERMQKKKVRNDRRNHVLILAMRELAAQGNERAQTALREYDLIG